MRAAAVLAALLLACPDAYAGSDLWTGGVPAPGRAEWVGVIPGATPVLLTRGYGGGLFRSTDEGASWTSLAPAVPAETEQSTGQPTDALVAPASLPGVAYLSQGNPTLLPKVLKTTDSGATWTPLTVRARCITGDPTDPATLYIGGLNRVARSTDGGATWAEGELPNIGQFFVSSIAVDAAAPAVVYAGDNAGDVFKSTDAGANFAVALPGNPGGPTSVHAIHVLHGDDAVTRILADSVNHLRRSTDDGATWQTVTTPPLPFFGELFTFLPLDPDGIQLLVGSDSGLFRSTDSGVSWQKTPPDAAWCGIRSLTLAPGGRVYASTFSGILQSDDAGATWSRLVAAPPADVWTLAGDARAPASAYAGTSGNAFRTTDDGATWTFLDGFGHDWILTFVSLPTVPATFLVGTWHGLLRSTNAGTSWQPVTLDGVYPPPGVVGLAAAPSAPGRVYAVDEAARLFMSTDGGATWAPRSVSSPWVLTVDRGDANTVLGVGDGVSRSTDAGATWTHTLTRFYEQPRAIAVDPIDHALVFAGTQQSLYRSSDGGLTFAKLTSVPSIASGEAVVRAVVADSRAGRVFLANDLGTYVSTDGGDTWAPFGDLPPGAVPHALVQSPADPSKLFCGTITRGVFALTIGSYPIAHGDVNGDGAVDALDVFTLLNFLFAGGASPFGISDANGDGTIDVLDVFYLINHIFAGGPAPV